MTKKYYLILLLLLLCLLSNVRGDATSDIPSPSPIPNVPSNCFNDDCYCVDTHLFKNQQGERVIRVDIFAKFSKWDFQSVDDIVARYFDFSNWPNYVSRNGEDHIVFLLSRELSPISENQQTIRRHETVFTSRAPIGRVEIRELTNYKKAEQTNGLLYGVDFYPAPNYAHVGARQMGGLYIKYYDKSEEEYLVFFRADSIPDPELNWASYIMASYIRNGMVSIFKGMFRL